MRIDRKLIDHVAKLAALSLSDAEADKLAVDVAAILGYVEQLGELDAELDAGAVPPTTSAGASTGATGAGGRPRFRADEVVPGLSHDEALAEAPRATEEGFAVPGFVEIQ